MVFEMQMAVWLIVAAMTYMGAQAPGAGVGRSATYRAEFSFQRVAELPPGTFAPTIFVLDSLHIWVAGETTIMATADGGQRWVTVRRPDCPEAHERSGRIRFSDPLRATFFVHGCLMKSLDGGKSWARLPVPAKYPDEINDVLFDANLRNGLAGGGLCMPLKAGVAPPNNAWCDQEGKRYLAATVFSTDDGGMSWRPQLLNYHASFRVTAVYKASPTLVFVLAQNALFRSGDDGSSWQRIDMASGCTSRDFPQEFENRPIGISFINERTGWLAYLEGDLLHTMDGGLHWCAIPAPKVSWRQGARWTAHFERLRFMSETGGWGIAGDGSVHYTRDGGQTWNKVDLSDISDLDVLPDGTVWAAGASGVFCSRHPQ